MLALATSAKQPDAVRGESHERPDRPGREEARRGAGQDPDRRRRVRGGCATRRPRCWARANQPETREAARRGVAGGAGPRAGADRGGAVADREGCGELVAAVEAGKASARLLTDKEVAVRVERSGRAAGPRDDGEADEGPARRRT